MGGRFCFSVACGVWISLCLRGYCHVGHSRDVRHLPLGELPWCLRIFQRWRRRSLPTGRICTEDCLLFFLWLWSVGPPVQWQLHCGLICQEPRWMSSQNYGGWSWSGQECLTRHGVGPVWLVRWYVVWGRGWQWCHSALCAGLGFCILVSVLVFLWTSPSLAGWNHRRVWLGGL